MKCFKMFVLAGAMLFALAASASAAVVSLNFEGLQDYEEILDFYNGGTGSMGSSGTNYGVAFGSGALALIDSDAGGSGNFANEPTPNTVAFWLEGGGLLMNVAAGFDTGFSFFYSSSDAVSVYVYDALNGAGNLLGTINLSANAQDGGCTGDPNGYYCNWDPIGVSFEGTAMSVDFTGGANHTGYDNITFGSRTPHGVPEPATMLLLGLGLIGITGMRKKLS